MDPPLMFCMEPPIFVHLLELEDVKCFYNLSTKLQKHLRKPSKMANTVRPLGTETSDTDTCPLNISKLQPVLLSLLIIRLH